MTTHLRAQWRARVAAKVPYGRHEVEESAASIYRTFYDLVWTQQRARWFDGILGARDFAHEVLASEGHPGVPVRHYPKDPLRARVVTEPEVAIEVGSGMDNDFTIVHECAHVLTLPLAEGEDPHGPRFQQVLGRLGERFLDVPAETWKTAARVPPYYHGTTSKLSPGDVLLPGDQVGKRMHPDLGYRTDEVYLADKAYATFYALLAMNKSSALDFHVYEVEPLGDVIPGYGEYTTSSARVIREVDATLADLEPWMVEELGIGGKVETSDEPYLDPDTEVRGWDYPYPDNSLRASWGRILADGYEVGIDRYDLNEFDWYVAHPPSDPNLRNIREGTERSEADAKRAINRVLREMRS